MAAVAGKAYLLADRKDGLVMIVPIESHTASAAGSTTRCMNNFTSDNGVIWNGLGSVCCARDAAEDHDRRRGSAVLHEWGQCPPGPIFDQVFLSAYIPDLGQPIGLTVIPGDSGSANNHVTNPPFTYYVTDHIGRGLSYDTQAQIVDVVAGPPQHSLTPPNGLTKDRQGRLIVTDRSGSIYRRIGAGSATSPSSSLVPAENSI